MSAGTIRRFILLIIATAAGIAAALLMPPPLPELSRDEFLDEVRAGHVRKIEIADQAVIVGQSTVRGEFRTGFDRCKDRGLPDELRAMGVEIWYSKSPPGI